MEINKNSTQRYSFTILVPLYNEEENIFALEKNLNLFLPNSLYSTCVVFINDGSTDNSLNLICEVCKRNSHFFYISLENNGGLSTALKAGIDYTFSDYLGYMDADMQTDPEDFNLLLNEIDNYGLVTGIRANRKDTFFKKIQSTIANGFRRAMTKDGISDTGCPLKVMHTHLAKRIPLFSGMHRFLPALIQLQKKEVQQIVVRHYPRYAGESKYHLWNRLTGPFIDCFAYRWMRKRYINYNVNANNIEE